MSLHLSRCSRDVIWSKTNCSPTGSYRRDSARQASNPWFRWFSTRMSGSSARCMTSMSYSLALAVSAGAHESAPRAASSIGTASASAHSKALRKPGLRELQKALTFFAHCLYDSAMVPLNIVGCIVLTSTSSIRSSYPRPPSSRALASLKALSVSLRNLSIASATCTPCCSARSSRCCREMISLRMASASVAMVTVSIDTTEGPSTDSAALPR